MVDGIEWKLVALQLVFFPYFADFSECETLTTGVPWIASLHRSAPSYLKLQAINHKNAA